jgi:hypothetical protein
MRCARHSVDGHYIAGRSIRCHRKPQHDAALLARLTNGISRTVGPILTQDLRTIQRLPTGIFHQQGVKANVLFFDNKSASKDPHTKEIWFHDFRTNIKFSLKKTPPRYEDLAEFIECYHPSNIHLR